MLMLDGDDAARKAAVKRYGKPGSRLDVKVFDLPGGVLHDALSEDEPGVKDLHCSSLTVS
jgi:hypothetical protein